MEYFLLPRKELVMHPPRPLTPEQVASLVAHMGKMRMEGFTFDELFAFIRIKQSLTSFTPTNPKDVRSIQLAVAREEPDHN